jgi:hypothetical protein
MTRATSSGLRNIVQQDAAPSLGEDFDAQDGASLVQLMPRASSSRS